MFDGHFVKSFGDVRYTGGRYQYYDWVSLKDLKLKLLETFAHGVGCSSKVKYDYYYKTYVGGDFGDFRLITNADYLYDIWSTLDADRMVVLYVVEPEKNDTIILLSNDDLEEERDEENESKKPFKTEGKKGQKSKGLSRKNTPKRITNSNVLKNRSQNKVEFIAETSFIYNTEYFFMLCQI